MSNTTHHNQTPSTHRRAHQSPRLQFIKHELDDATTSSHRRTHTRTSAETRYNKDTTNKPQPPTHGSSVLVPPLRVKNATHSVSRPFTARTSTSAGTASSSLSMSLTARPQWRPFRARPSTSEVRQSTQSLTRRGSVPDSQPPVCAKIAKPLPARLLGVGGAPLTPMSTLPVMQDPNDCCAVPFTCFDVDSSFLGPHITLEQSVLMGNGGKSPQPIPSNLEEASSRGGQPPTRTEAPPDSQQSSTAPPEQLQRTSTDPPLKIDTSSNAMRPPDYTPHFRATPVYHRIDTPLGSGQVPLSPPPTSSLVGPNQFGSLLGERRNLVLVVSQDDKLHHIISNAAKAININFVVAWDLDEMAHLFSRMCPSLMIIDTRKNVLGWELMMTIREKPLYGRVCLFMVADVSDKRAVKMQRANQLSLWTGVETWLMPLHAQTCCDRMTVHLRSSGHLRQPPPLVTQDALLTEAVTQRTAMELATDVPESEEEKILREIFPEDGVYSRQSMDVVEERKAMCRDALKSRRQMLEAKSYVPLLIPSTEGKEVLYNFGREDMGANQSWYRYYLMCEQLGTTPVTQLFYHFGNDTLNLAHYGIADLGCKALADGLHVNTSVTHLNLSDNGLTHVGLDALATAFAAKHQLMAIELNKNPLGVRGASSVATLLLSQPGLIAVELEDVGFGNDGFMLLRPVLLDLELLSRINLSKNSLTDSIGCLLVKTVLAFGHLRDIDLSWNLLGDELCAQLQTQLKNNKLLTRLDLGWNSIRDEGAIRLGDMLKGNEGLRFLFVNNNHIGLAGGLVLASSIRANSTLELLDLDFNPLGGVARRALMKAGVKYMSLRGTTCAGQEGVLEFDENNPNGHYQLDLSNAWERWIGRELLHRVFCKLGKISNLKLSGRLFLGMRIVNERAKLPTDGFFEFDFKVVDNPKASRFFKLDLSKPGDRMILSTVRSRLGRFREYEFAKEMRLNGRFFELPRDPDWIPPEQGELRFRYAVYGLPPGATDLQGAVTLDLHLPWDRAMASTLCAGMVHDKLRQRQANIRLDGVPYIPKIGSQVPAVGQMTLLLDAKKTSKKLVLQYSLDLSDQWPAWVCRMIWRRLLSRVDTPYPDETVDATLDGQPYSIPLLLRVWQIPAAGVLAFDYVIRDPREISTQRQLVDMGDPAQALKFSELFHSAEFQNCSNLRVSGRPLNVPSTLEARKRFHLPKQGKLTMERHSLKPQPHMNDSNLLELERVKEPSMARSARIKIVTRFVESQIISAFQAFEIMRLIFPLINLNDHERVARTLCERCSDPHNLYAMMLKHPPGLDG